MLSLIEENEMDYTLKISPRMLELLSKDLYTNLYFVLAELIANSYDADAENVYLFINESEIRVEDDGKGMSSDNLSNQYLHVGAESRSNITNEKTVGKNRLRMGRKGVGKLAALSISDGFKLVTIQDNNPIGLFIPKQIQSDTEVLRILRADEYSLRKIRSHGTAVIMENPKISIPKLRSTIEKNIGKIFPNKISDFTIHLIFAGQETIITSNEQEIIPRLGTLIIIGDEFQSLGNLFDNQLETQFKQVLNPFIENTKIKSKDGTLRDLPVKIHGWIGTYRTTRDMKKEINEFSDNYLAIFAHNKMGIRNVLPIVGKNRVYESYIVGHLYIDAFENSDFPDMAGTNRQGYNENDPRWVLAVNFIRQLTDESVKLHQKFSVLEKQKSESVKLQKKLNQEKNLKEKLAVISTQITSGISSDYVSQGSNFDISKSVIRNLEVAKPMLGLKSLVDSNKKKILISQTGLDKSISDIVYKMLLFNGVPKTDIIYSSGDDPETNLPERNIYDYLMNFFVNSVSDQKIFVLFILSDNIIPKLPDLSSGWGVMMEIGAAWVTKRDSWMFNINGFRPSSPLHIEDKWVSIYSKVDNGSTIVTLTPAMVNSFCLKIISACNDCGYTPKEVNVNKTYLVNNYVTIFNP